MAHGHPVKGEKLGLAIGLTLLFVALEAGAGLYSRSLALVSDAGHNLADALALGFSAWAIWVARRPSGKRRTWGSHRAQILAALVNAVSLVGIALWIFWEAFQRFLHPEPIDSGVMIGVAVVAVALNGLIGWWLHKDAQHDLNMRSAYLHMLGDAAAGAAVFIAGIMVALTRQTVWDPIVSFIIGGLILWSSWGILAESIEVLLEGTPTGMDMDQVATAIQAVPGVLNVHDLHVWTVASGIHACSCHILVEEQSILSGQQVLRAVTEDLKRRFHICHTTVQVEVEGCPEDDMYCTLRALHAHAHDHPKPHDHDHSGHEHHHDDHGHGHTHGGQAHTASQHE